MRRKKFCVTWYATFQIPKAIVTPRACSPQQSGDAIRQQINIRDVDVEDIYIGNGVSELVVMSMQALVNDGDEILVPCPDFPLERRSKLAGANPFTTCDEEDNWQPDLADIRSKITPNTRGIVVINPNNPTGAVYSPGMQKALINRSGTRSVAADEIYDKILFDDRSTFRWRLTQTICCS